MSRQQKRASEEAAAVTSEEAASERAITREEAAASEGAVAAAVARSNHLCASRVNLKESLKSVNALKDGKNKRIRCIRYRLPRVHDCKLKGLQVCRQSTAKQCNSKA